MAEVKGKGYESYRDMISDVDGTPVDKKAREKAREKAGVTTLDLAFKLSLSAVEVASETT